MMTQGEALGVLKTGANVFLTGEPGSGKTHTVNAYVAWLRARGIEPAITASTGIAATHIGGLTIHSWSGIGVKRWLSEEDLDAIAQKKNVVKRVADTSVLIIDEVSMLSAGTLSMVDAVLREVRRTAQPFGGLQVVLVGDFFQLPPVSRRGERHEIAARGLFSTGRNDETDGFAFMSPVWGAMKPLVCYLSEQYRQEDAEFLELLLALRQGAFTDAHRSLLEERMAAEPKQDMPKLYSHNADVDAINAQELAKLKTPLHTFTMKEHGPEQVVSALKRGCLSPEELSLKEGARVMFTKNDVARGRYVNGTLGTITGFAKESGYPMVKTRSGRTIEAEPDEWRVEDGGRVIAKIEQVPLRLAWAMTIHKSQGMSLDAAHMDLSQTFEYGQGYVALSRVRTLSGISLGGLNERALEVHPDILGKDAEFRAFSEKARAAFGDMPESELEAMHANFVKACGGKEPEPGTENRAKTSADVGRPQMRTKIHNALTPDIGCRVLRGTERWRGTFELLASGKNLEEVADELGVQVATVFKHLERLAEKEQPDWERLAHLASAKDIERAIAVFDTLEHAYLKPVFEALNEQIPYETIHLARLIGGFAPPPSNEKNQKPTP